jgi:hypothetical protein
VLQREPSGGPLLSGALSEKVSDGLHPHFGGRSPLGTEPRMRSGSFFAHAADGLQSGARSCALLEPIFQKTTFFGKAFCLEVIIGPINLRTTKKEGGNLVGISSDFAPENPPNPLFTKNKEEKT